MDKKDLLNSDFLKQFKNGDELKEFLHELQKRGVEQLLEGELDAHLGYDKYQKSDNPNSRNGHDPESVFN
ncbi:transposase [Saccharicrinis sp. FJH2]|uniref:transposase n=1 Tax=Saccharicrinis sp. FJH65 TaxID=3344659 RepID=UPI0035F2AC98